MSANYRVESDCDSCLAFRAAFDSGDMEIGSNITQCDGLGISYA